VKVFLRKKNRKEITFEERRKKPQEKFVDHNLNGITGSSGDPHFNWFFHFIYLVWFDIQVRVRRNAIYFWKWTELGWCW
jgi:hypothetical protein